LLATFFHDVLLFLGRFLRWWRRASSSLP